MRWAFTVTEYEAARPWIVVGAERREVELADGVSFFEWAAAEWPVPRFSVHLEPWQLSDGLRKVDGADA